MDCENCLCNSCEYSIFGYPCLKQCYKCSEQGAVIECLYFIPVNEED